MSTPDIRAAVEAGLRTVQGTRHHLGLVTLQVLTDCVTEAVTPLVAEVTRANAALLEDRACDADFTESRDYCTGLREGVELLTRAAGGEQATATPATATPDFFQPGRTYTREHHGRTIEFRVTAVDTSPDGEQRLARGWRTHEHSDWEPTDSDDLTGWVDVTEGGDGR